MCGICGQLRWDGASVDKTLLKTMNDRITHRGPDDEGFYISPSSENGGRLSVGLAMRRLSIIDLSGGHQPITNEDGSIVVVYNGETYNFAELRSELEARGHQFRTRSDTEVLVHGYEVWGDAMPAKLNGMFAFALWDGRRRRLLLGRDRMGIKPLHYALLADRLVFGSEIKCLMADPAVPSDLDHHALDDFLSLRYVPCPASAYKAVRKLEPGCTMAVENGRTTISRYWSPEPGVETGRPLSYYLEKTDSLLEDAVRLQMVSEVPLGTFLSGGIDSPAITYYAKKFKPDLKTFTIHFADKSFSEREEARLVATHLGTEHIDMEVSPDVEHLIPSLIDSFDEPFSDDSMIPSYYLNKLAREHMTVALSGDGGDELFGGYSTYLADQAAGVYRRIPGFLRRGVIEPAINRLPVSFGRISWDYKLKAFVAAAGRPSPLEHFGWTEVYTPDLKADLYSPEFLRLTQGHDAAESYRRAFDEAGERGTMEKFLYVDQKTHLLDEFLVKVDRMSMANSMEVRPPFLDHRLVEWALKIPFDLKIRRGVTKYILRRLFRDRLPAPIIGGAKKGFSPPISRWLAGELLPYARKKLSPEHLSAIPLLNPKGPGRILDAHVARRANMGRKLWTILMFVEWYDRKVLKRA